MVVEITPPGIRSLGWRFYIIWCVFNFAFIPTGKSPFSSHHFPPHPPLTPHPTSLLLLPRDRRPHARRPGPLLRRRRPATRVPRQGSDRLAPPGAVRAEREGRDAAAQQRGRDGCAGGEPGGAEEERGGRRVQGWRVGLGNWRVLDEMGGVCEEWECWWWGWGGGRFIYRSCEGTADPSAPQNPSSLIQRAKIHLLPHRQK